MERHEVELAEMNLRVSESLYATARNIDERLDAAFKIVMARSRLDAVRQEFQRSKDLAALCIASIYAEHCESLVSGAVLLQVRQSYAQFTAKENSDDDGWQWPVRIMNVGFAHGSVTMPDGQRAALPHYF